MDSTDGRWDKVAVRRSQKAGILMEMGQDGQAREELEKAVPVFREGNNLNSLAISLAQIGEIAFEAGEVSAAEKAYEECLEVCTDTGNKYIESRVRKDLWQMYRDTQKDKGLLHLERYVDLQNELNSDRTAELMQHFNVKYDTLKKEQTITGAFLAVLKNKAAKAMAIEQYVPFDASSTDFRSTLISGTVYSTHPDVGPMISILSPTLRE